MTDRDADGFIGLQVDVYGEQKSGAPPFEAHFPPGIIHRHRDPDVGPDGQPTLGANVLYAWEGNTGHAIPLTDPRVVALLPNTVEPGGTLLYAHRDDGQLSIMRLSGTDGAFVVYVPAPNGNGYGIQLRIDHTNGFDLVTPWNRLTVGPLGLSFTHGQAQFSLGNATLPAPLNALSSFAVLKAGVVNVRGGAVSLGTDGGAANEGAIVALLAALTAIATTLAEISATPATVGSPVLTPAQLSPVTSAMSALAAAIHGLGKTI